MTSKSSNQNAISYQRTFAAVEQAWDQLEVEDKATFQTVKNILDSEWDVQFGNDDRKAVRALIASQILKEIDQRSGSSESTG